MINLKDLNDEQKEAVQYLEGPLLIIAGAGSGKTKCLTYRYANLIEHKIDPLNILLLTFTNKAAAEMTTRAQKLLNKEDKNMKGMTYHSFCAELLRHYAEYVSFKPNFTICDDSDMVEIINLVKEKKGYTTKEM
jgi:DNA helicase-2/ATP-dependent DNA helicase PcrA